MVRYQALGPLLAGEGSRAFLGLAIEADNRASPVVLIWVPDVAERDAELLSKIKRETEHAAKLDHPNIVRVFGFAKLDEGHARVVEFADGESLRKIIETAKKLPPRIAARIVLDACTGAHYAHVAGNDDGTPLVHGDLRPETMLISFNGVTKVTGYGALAFAPREMGGQRVKGRRVHSAPEQIIGGRDAITIPTDVYLLGLTLYECLTGAVPWADQGDFFDHAVLSLPLPPATPGDIPETIEKVLQKACAKKASERYPNPYVMREALAEAVGSEVATTEELGQYLDTLFPDSHQLRADRRHTIDAGIADYIRRHWADLEKDKAAGQAAPTLPMMPAVVPPSAVPPVSAPPRPRPPSKSGLPVAPPPSEEEAEEEEKSSSTPWIVLAAVIVAAAGIWWGIEKANEPIPVKVPVEELMRSDAGHVVIEPPVVPDAAVEAVAAVVDAGSAVAQADAGAIADAGVAQAARPDAGAAAAVVPAADAGPAIASEVEVQIESVPIVNLSLEGKPLGQTPWSGKLPPGKKVFRLENKDLGVNTTRVINVKGDEAVSEKFTFERGFVTVVAPEGATVFIDGVRKGTAPIRGEIPVFEGAHRIDVHVGKARWGENFNISPGNNRVSFTVEAE